MRLSITTLAVGAIFLVFRCAAVSADPPHASYGFEGAGWPAGPACGPHGWFDYAGGPYLPPLPPYGTYYNPGTGEIEYFLPPVYFPAELAYGPQAVMRFWGIRPWPPVVGERPERKPREPRVSNAATLERARRLVRVGDELFRKQQYHQALQQYKAASRIAPDLAEAWFRQGHALVATNRYELAADAFRRGLAVDRGFLNDPFRLDEIYGDARLAKQSHLDALATAALKDPTNADLMLLLGMTLHFDGQQARAEKFIRRAAELIAAKRAAPPTPTTAPAATE